MDQWQGRGQARKQLMTHRDWRAKLLPGGVGEGFMEGVVFELDLDPSIGGGSFLGREGHPRLKEQ